MGNQSLIVPEELRQSLDALVAAARSGVRKPPGAAFDLVTSWCEANPDESGLMAGDYGEGFLVVCLDGELAGCSDDEIELPEGVDESELSDDVRLACIRDRLEQIFNGASDDAGTYPMGCFIRVRASTGGNAILGFYLSGGGGMGGLDVHWDGIYRNVKEFREELRRSGYLTGPEDAEKTGDAALLKLWRRRSSPTSEQEQAS